MGSSGEGPAGYQRVAVCRCLQGTGHIPGSPSCPVPGASEEPSAVRDLPASLPEQAARDEPPGAGRRLPRSQGFRKGSGPRPPAPARPEGSPEEARH